ncbi:MAG TPA: SDR family oxidoreductase [bacterium]
MKTGSAWALILGSSSGFGEAISLELAAEGYNIFGVHLDRKVTQPKVDSIINLIKSKNVAVQFFNVNAADDIKRKGVIESIEKTLIATNSALRILVHSIAFGTLRPFISDNEKEFISRAQIEMTLDVMANSLIYWVQDIVSKKIMSAGGRVFAMTSAGSHRVWHDYGAVSAAKSALESYIRQLAVELAPKGITANAVCAGVTDTPALRKIPGHEKMIEIASQRNPSGRMTTPSDAAKAIVALSHEGTNWITGNIINVDGGEDIAG